MGASEPLRGTLPATLPLAHRSYAHVPPAERWAPQSLLVAFAFQCNLACTFCMVEDVLKAYDGTSLDAFRRSVADPRTLSGVKRIIFSGGEVTLARDLVEYIRFARSLPGIEHVRLQTNGVRLADRAYLQCLIDAGADEYFISLHGHDAASCDAITQRSGSFVEILGGMRAVRELGATLITNTAITQSTLRSLPHIASVVAPFSPQSMELWSYWPRADERGARGHFARIAEVQGPLLEAIASCLERRIAPVVKWFPRCLLGEHSIYHDDGQPRSVIELSRRSTSAPQARDILSKAPEYFDREPRYACIYEGVCEEAGPLAEKHTPASGRCAGLPEPYILRFGWEADVLSPKRKSPAPPFDPALSLTKDAGPKRARAAEMALFLDRFGLSVGREIAGLSLSSAVRSEAGAMVSLVFESGKEVVIVRICPRDEARRAPFRARSFDLFYALRDVHDKERAVHLLRVLVDLISRGDPGGLELPSGGVAFSLETRDDERRRGASPPGEGGSS